MQDEGVDERFPFLEGPPKSIPFFLFRDLSLQPLMNHIDADRALCSKHLTPRLLVCVQNVEPTGTRFAPS